MFIFITKVTGAFHILNESSIWLYFMNKVAVDTGYRGTCSELILLICLCICKPTQWLSGEVNLLYFAEMHKAGGLIPISLCCWEWMSLQPLMHLYQLNKWQCSAPLQSNKLMGWFLSVVRRLLTCVPIVAIVQLWSTNKTSCLVLDFLSQSLRQHFLIFHISDKRLKCSSFWEILCFLFWLLVSGRNFAAYFDLKYICTFLWLKA